MKKSEHFRSARMGVTIVKIQESGENYLETILIDVANYLNFSKASVSRAMGILKEAGYLTMEPNGSLVLTESGRMKAGSVYERHTLIAKFLEMTLGVSSEIALQDSCRIEHVISAESFEQIKKYTQKPNS